MKIGGKIQPGVDRSGWLVVGCDKLRNGTSDSLGLVWEDEIVPDILENIPHDSLRIYLAGFSGGALRAYELTTRRPEQFAGVIAYGGWLGGYYTYPKLYRHGMAAAQVNGVNDIGAGYWTEIDAEVLKKRYCSVKHFSHPKGHSIAPADVTQRVITWLDQEWNRKQGVDGIRISPGSASLALGTSQWLSLIVAPGYNMEQGIRWRSKNDRIAEVDDFGVISGISTGTTRIIASTIDGKYSDTCSVRVYISVDGVTISQQYMTLGSIGETGDLIATVSPPEATDRSVIWSSGDTLVALVDEQGTVTSVGVGRTIIEVRTRDAGYSARCIVSVYMKVTGVSIDSTDILLDSLGAMHKLGAEVSPPDAWNKTLWWHSTDPRVARVSNDGTVTAVGPGITSIEVESDDGGHTASCKVTVSLSPSGIEKVSGDRITVYPNPAVGIIHIEGEAIFSRGFNLYMYDMSGKEVYQNLNLNSDGHPVTIPLPQLPGGIYLIKTTDDHTIAFSKLFVQ